MSILPPDGSTVKATLKESKSAGLSLRKALGRSREGVVFQLHEVAYNLIRLDNMDSSWDDMALRPWTSAIRDDAVLGALRSWQGGITSESA